jgi:L-ascorbate metabolism protein UlaG (beta-lactamase superfamily)
MKFVFLSAIFMVLITPLSGFAQQEFVKDTIKTSTGNLEITFIGHGSLMFTFDGKVIHVDPYGSLADYSKLPKADMIFVTHSHRDHLDPKALGQVRTEKTIIVIPESCADAVAGAIIMRNGDIKDIDDLKIEAIPAYNLVHMRSPGVPFHPKGDGNGYVMTFGDKRVYVAGDTENTPEMKALRDIHIAFLPMNPPYTMTPEMVADAVKAFKPKILYPYHYGETDTSILLDLLKDTNQTEVIIRPMK